MKKILAGIACVGCVIASDDDAGDTPSSPPTTYQQAVDTNGGPAVVLTNLAHADEDQQQQFVAMAADQLVRDARESNADPRAAEILRAGAALVNAVERAQVLNQVMPASNAAQATNMAVQVAGLGVVVAHYTAAERNAADEILRRG